MDSFGIKGIGASLSSLRNLRDNLNDAADSIKRMGTGQRINSAADDPAGLAVSERLRSQVLGLSRQAMNAMDQVSMVQVADAGAGEIHSALQNIEELSVQAANGVYTADDRAAIQQQISANVEHIQSVAANTEFNTKPLLQGSLGGDMSPAALGISGLNVMTPGSAAESISVAQEAIGTVSEFRSGLGAMQNELTSSIRSLDVAVENTLAAESRIRDLDYAQEVTNSARANILAQTNITALAQANLASEAVLGLLTGNK